MAKQTKKPAPKKKATPKARSVKTPVSRVNSEGKRVRSLTKHRSFKLSKKRIRTHKPLPRVRDLVKDPIKLVLKNKKLFFGLTLVYSILSFVFIKGLGSAFDLVDTKQQIQDYFGNNIKDLETSYVLFDHLLKSFNGSLGEVAGTYQLFFSIILILAVVWICRKLYSGEKTRVKEAFYKGMYPIVPFILVLLVITLQLIPSAIGNFLLSTVLTNGLAVTMLEKGIWVLVFILLSVLSLYMITSSVFALNIVTLQDLTPMQALRSARDLVLHRRLGVFGRLLILPILGLLALGIIFMPLVLVAPLLAEPLFLLASSFGLIFATVYIYNFYRKLL